MRKTAAECIDKMIQQKNDIDKFEITRKIYLVTNKK